MANKLDAKYEPLFTPWKIGNVEIKNRIVLCPMGGTSLFGWMEMTGNHFDKESAKFFIKKQKTMWDLLSQALHQLRVLIWGNGFIKTKKCLNN